MHGAITGYIAEAAEVSLGTVAMYYPAKLDIALSRFSDGMASLTDAIDDRRRGETVHDAYGSWLLTSQTAAEEREFYQVARRMSAANPDLGPAHSPDGGRGAGRRDCGQQPSAGAERSGL